MSYRSGSRQKQVSSHNSTEEMPDWSSDSDDDGNAKSPKKIANDKVSKEKAKFFKRSLSTSKDAKSAKSDIANYPKSKRQSSPNSDRSSMTSDSESRADLPDPCDGIQKVHPNLSIPSAVADGSGESGCSSPPPEDKRYSGSSSSSLPPPRSLLDGLSHLFTSSSEARKEESNTGAAGKPLEGSPITHPSPNAYIAAFREAIIAVCNLLSLKHQKPLSPNSLLSLD